MEPIKFDVVILDLRLPDMDGMELAQKLLSLRPDIPIVISTGLLDPGMIKEFNEMGIQELLQKPFSVLGLGKIIERVLVE